MRTNESFPDHVQTAESDIDIERVVHLSPPLLTLSLSPELGLVPYYVLEVPPDQVQLLIAPAFVGKIHHSLKATEHKCNTMKDSSLFRRPSTTKRLP